MSDPRPRPTGPVRQPPPPMSLGRELRAVLLLYVILAVIPLLIGWLMGKTP